MDAFDADVLIYAAVPDHPLGRRVAVLFPSGPRSAVTAGVGSQLLVPELLGKPMRDGNVTEIRALTGLLRRLELRPLDGATARLAAALSAAFRLRAADATHLATAVAAGADRFLTNNAKTLPQTIAETEIVYPADLPDPDQKA